MSEFESDLGAEAGADPGVEAAPSVEAAVEGAPSPETPEAAPAWTPDPDEWEATQARLAMLDQRFGQIAQPQQQPQQGEEVDWNEHLNALSDNYGTNLINTLQQRDQFLLGEVAKLVQPLVAKSQQQEAAESSEMIKDVIADEVARNGDMSEDAKGLVEPLARAFYPQFQERYSYMGPMAANKAADAAMQQTFKTLRAVEKAAEERGANRATNHLNTLANANREPGTPGAALQHGDANSVDEALERWQSSRTAA